MGFVSDLEDYLIDPSHWHDDESWRDVMPEDIQKSIDEKEPCIGLGHHPEKGWIVMCCGQGPFLAWSEK
jgi:hypothetical protein